MNDQEAIQQTKQMERFILKEAEDKAEEIRSKGDEEFQIEKFRILTEKKEKIRAEYARKAKHVETQCAIARSLAINKSRLQKIKARQEILGRISTDAQRVLQDQMVKESESRPFITKLMLQGALMLLEDNVAVRCRECDIALVESCLSDVTKQYSEVIRQETGAVKTMKLTVDKSKYLPPAPLPGSEAKSCLGGVVLSCQNDSIVIDNTIDLRLRLMLEQDKP
eukprot:CAMPEP_0169211178 /NCGR_PEP_ID=MMETSP1016-20121227/15609_1 /TAXON_ID=342587 /ORGANISM="Karlodinium micrum, Strain CCMP2283" /LENGTH=222 /DNA_ID=CAMNT_0009288767 /DNA_START=33 /DNA_END=698 /DNA_ORIENTATION=+